MKTTLLAISLFCFSLLMHGQEQVLKVTLEDIMPYDTLKCSAVIECSDKISYLGGYRTGTNSWLFHIPDTILEKSEYIRFFANRENTLEIKYIRPSFRIIAERDTTHFWSELSFFEKIDTLSLHAKFVRQDTVRNSTYYGTYGTNKIVITPRFDLITPSSELQRSIVNINDVFFKYENAPSGEFYDTFYRIISQSPNSHSNMILFYDRRNWFSLEQRDSFFGRKLDEYKGGETMRVKVQSV